MLTEQLGGGGPLDRFLGFTEDMVDLVLGQGGSLKAEHGTGRMMAPYVRRQYGDELYEVMRGDQAALRSRADCSTRGADLRRPGRPHQSPQGRADGREGGRPLRGMRVLRTGLPEPGHHHHTAATDRAAPGDAARRGRRRRRAGRRNCEEEYEYDAIDTCAVDGMCQTACPVSINTGDLMKRLRADNAGKIAEEGLGDCGASTGPGRHGRRRLRCRHRQAARRAGHRAEQAGPQGDRPGRVAAVVAGAARRRWAATTDAPTPGRRHDGRSRPEAVYFTACVGTMFGPSEAGPGVRESLHPDLRDGPGSP